MIDDYKCKVCNHIEEKWLSGKEREQPQPCPRCPAKGRTMERMLASPSFKIDVEAPHFVPKHVQRARNLGHDGATSKTEGSYD